MRERSKLKPAVPLRHERPRMGLSSRKNWVQENTASVIPLQKRIEEPARVRQWGCFGTSRKSTLEIAFCTGACRICSSHSPKIHHPSPAQMDYMKKPDFGKVPAYLLELKAAGEGGETGSGSEDLEAESSRTDDSSRVQVYINELAAQVLCHFGTVCPALTFSRD